MSFHTRLTLRASWYAPPDTGVPNLQLVALEPLLSIEGALEIQMDVTFLRGPCRGGALLRPFFRRDQHPRAEQSPAPTERIPKAPLAGELSAKQTERLSQIRLNLSVSAPPSHLPWKGRLWDCALQGFPYEGKAGAAEN